MGLTRNSSVHLRTLPGMAIKYYCKIKCIKVKDLLKIDGRIINAHRPTWKQDASEYKLKLRENIEKELVSFIHNYSTEFEYQLIDIPIVPESNALVICNTASKPRDFTSYRIDFYNVDRVKIGTNIASAICVRNLFTVPIPQGAVSLNYCIGNGSWNRHYYHFEFDCADCLRNNDDDLL